MYTKEEKLALLNESIFVLKQKGIIRTQADLARKIGILPSSLSTAKNGREAYLTDQLIFRIRDFLVREGITLPSEEITRPTPVSVPLETIELFNSMSASIERLTKEVQRLNSVIENLSKGDPHVKRA